MGQNGVTTVQTKYINKIKTGIILFGLLSGIMWSIFLYIHFLLAYLSPTKTVLIGIDYFSEANLELLLIPVCIIICCAGLILFIRH